MKRHKMIINYILLFLSVFFFIVTLWARANCAFTSFDEILYTIISPLEGTGNGMIVKFILINIGIPILVLLVVIGIRNLRKKYDLIVKINLFKKNIKFNLFHFKFDRLFKYVPLLLFIISFWYMGSKLYFFKFISYQFQKSNFIEENYVSPKDVSIEFPDKKRNLIYIYLESMEMTYADKDSGGSFDKNYIPELSSLAKKNVNFSNTDNLGGAYVVGAATWTIGAMVAQTTGLPLKTPFNGNLLLNYYNEIVPGAYSLGKILEDNGYKNYIMFGSDAAFAGRDVYYKNHGNYKIYDYNSAIKDGIIDKDYFVFWGMEDEKLFTYAKKELKKISKNNEPFNFTLLTVDTHFIDGYTSDFCKEVSDNIYLNSVACSSYQVNEFIKWLKKQSFYENTTIVIVGDHLSMNNYSFNDIPDNNRTVFNTFINSNESTNNTNNRIFSTMDYFPTTIASLGATIEGDRLGLGTNLFSDKKTLTEEYGLEYVNTELNKNSKYYNNCIINKKC